MGIRREDGGYSASVQGFLVVAGSRYQLAKTNGETLHLADPCELPPGTEAEMHIIVDGDDNSKRIVLPAGVALGQTRVPYEVAVPF